MTALLPSPARLLAVLIKEVIQMRRDRLTFAMMLGVPIMQLLLFGYAINTDPRNLPTAFLDLSHDRFSRAIAATLQVSDYYRITALPGSAAEADALIQRGDVAFVVTIPSDFGRRVQRGENPVLLVEADATDPAAASGAIAVLPELVSRALRREMQLGVASSTALANVVVHKRYNPETITQYNIVPGLLGVILQMTLTMITSMALTREVERGTMESLLAMPATPLEIMLGKILPYIGLGFVQVAVILLSAHWLFAVPFHGSLSLLLLGLLGLITSLVMLSYSFSTFSRTQMQAMQLSIFFFLPSMLLSGFMFPFRGMPGWAQTIGEFLPLTHFLRVVRAIMLKGAEWNSVADEIMILAAFAIVAAALALLRFRRTLD